MDLLYRKVKQQTGERRRNRNFHIKDNDGILLTEPALVQERWKEYVEELYDGKAKPKAEDVWRITYRQICRGHHYSLVNLKWH